ncbi:MAG TPA: CDGSH iron-sulfur domain-containing protein [Chitinophaga sp.]|uniref:CDGSH iron-sulfur domain-containing protein n=1 Tax=Chitinophaga sp. TaxID=1869181 RepID=UPI002BD61695|nr:CDGSH iron-sulfur domain-containing protein [Chitinophaga sp.]HVI48603.1 CDGSH iron-sulfur domain-containing protein [Chitinophaga sp.]
MEKHPDIRIRVVKNGPYQVSGNVPLQIQTIGANTEGESIEWIAGRHITPESQPFYLCRCGHSRNKPFCDNSHKQALFDGTETAGHTNYIEEADLMEGPAMLLTDVQKLCAFARFCDPNGQVWGMVNETDDPAIKEQFIKQASECPSGRLIAWDKATQTPIEPQLEASIGIIEDPAQGISGPLWIRGGIEIADATNNPYEIRNRVTLCRCGASRNKPYCDGSHASIKFHDGLE